MFQVKQDDAGLLYEQDAQGLLQSEQSLYPHPYNGFYT